ncbi:TetR/AcrR family transcriptional regulator [Brevibacterium album]|uniref:TetR/AcrR family transcriptional regulator n=1 Tax=Brevibacterium album TaxID=417948 RepID=UPI0004253785|nr:TetR/AcrR family transcriptional regulator [Brevibacterium album]
MSRQNGGNGADRAAQIRAAAALLFRQRGYQEIGIDEIGAAVGISGPAIYRHFRGKDALLAAIVETHLHTLRKTWLGLGGTERPTAILEAVIETALDDPDGYFVFAYQRQHLGAEAQERVHLIRADIRAPWKDLLAEYGVTLTSPEGRLKLTALQGMFIHVGLTRNASRTRRAAIAGDMAARILAAPLPAAPGKEDPAAGAPEASTAQAQAPGQGAGPTQAEPAPLRHVNRGEAVLTAASALFRRSGFNAVTLKDIGAEVGVTPSAIHRHFPSKESVLAQIVARGHDLLLTAVDFALRSAGTPGEAVRIMIERFCRLHVEFSDLFGINFTMAAGADPEARTESKRRRRVTVEEVASKLHDAFPDMPLKEARVRIGAVFSILARTVQSDEVLRHPSLAHELTAICISATLGSSPESPTSAS